jgi:hypothetical protein
MADRARGIRRWMALFGAFAIAVSVQGIALADGTEILDTPSVPIAAGSGTVAAGTGLQAGPGTIDITVPGTPAQALLYWEVQKKGPIAATEQYTVGATPVTGTLIGGPTTFFSGYQTTVYRADVTSLVASGANSLLVTPIAPGVPVNRINDGAGLLVIYEDGTDAEIGIVDGADVAFINAPDLPREVTIPRTFTFTPEPVDRQADLTIFTASVSDDVDGPPLRPTGITVQADGTVVVVFDTELDSNDGYEWDTFTPSITVPAGVSSITVEVQSEDNLDTGDLPASLIWIAAGLAVPITPEDGGGQGCTPGYWKQEHHFDSWVSTGYAPGDSFDDTFGVESSFDTLLDGVAAKGGQENALARHAVAALLNAGSPGVSYEFSTADVIAKVQAAYDTEDWNFYKDMLEYQNEMGCPLN